MKYVTSMSTQGFKDYGKRMLDSWVRTQKHPIHVYTEGKRPDYRHPLVKWHDLFAVPGAKKVTEALSVFPVTSGFIGNQYSYIHNANTFCRKVFAQCDAAIGYNGLLIWVDADTLFLRELEDDWIEDRIGEHFMAYQGRSAWHSCASFVIWNTEHEQNVPFWEAYFSLIVTGKFLLLPQWHDSFWLDALRDGMELDATNMTPLDVYSQDGPVNVFNAVMDGRAIHFKGMKKNRYSQLIELVAQRKPDTIVEIGTWNGHRAIEMCRINDSYYYGFDLFEDATEETDRKEKNVKPHFSLAEVDELLTREGIRHELFKGDTKETFRQWVEGQEPVDFIFIDGGHSVETIRSDLENALRISDGSTVIVLDDWYEGIDTSEVGCNRVLEEMGLEYEVLPIADPVKGGGTVQMVVLK